MKRLNGLSIKKFLQEYWQKKPLFIPKAVADFHGLLNRQDLQYLACQDEVQSRLVQYNKSRWQLRTGPFRPQDFRKLSGHWTLLVQDVNHFLPAAHDLLLQFNFIPYARLDDLMVSFAPDGAGVGPHFDSYDVFLLQGSGKRRWQISGQADQRLLPDTPLRILQNFQAEEEYLLEPGDMLYLPPNYAHNGIAVGDCMTYSIGFRTPRYQDLGQEFFAYMQDHCELEGWYQDPGLKPSRDPAKIPAAMLAELTKVIQGIRYNKQEIAKFLGNYLSEPKAHCFFDPPKKPCSKRKFFQLFLQKGVELDTKTQMLFTNTHLFMNGQAYPLLQKIPAWLRKLANERRLRLIADPPPLMQDWLYQWYLDGYILIAE